MGQSAYYGRGQGDTALSLSPVIPYGDIPTLGRQPNGLIVLNPAKDMQSVFRINASTFPIVLAPFGQITVTFTVPADENVAGDMEITDCIGYSTGRYSISLTHQGTNRILQNAPVSSNLVTGSSWVPFRFPQSIFCRATNSIQAVITDLSGAPNTIRLSVQGRRFFDYNGAINREAVQRCFEAQRTHYFAMVPDGGAEITVPAAAAGTIFQVNYTIPSMADFEWVSTTTDCTDTTGVIGTWSGLGQWLVGAGGRNFGDPADIPSFIGSPTMSVLGFQDGLIRSGQFPFAWGGSGCGFDGGGCGFTQLLKRGTVVRLNVTQVSGLAQTLRVAMLGRLVYYDECDGLNTSTDALYSLPQQRAILPRSGRGGMPARCPPVGGWGCPPQGAPQAAPQPQTQQINVQGAPALAGLRRRPAWRS